MPKDISEENKIILEKKAFVWIKTAYSLNGTWAKIFLRENGVLVKDRILGLKSVDFPYSSISSVERDMNTVTVRFRCGRRNCWVRIKVKKGGDELEYLINQQISDKRHDGAR